MSEQKTKKHVPQTMCSATNCRWTGVKLTISITFKTYVKFFNFLLVSYSCYLTIMFDVTTGHNIRSKTYNINKIVLKKRDS